ncbi:MAG: threonine synthase [Planctomycetes bacterium]|nr:threonine synthase [Planctomycetota bacterium]
MRYYSTRDTSIDFSFKEVVSSGLSTEGGLFVPKEIPDLSSELPSWAGKTYPEMAAAIFTLFADESINPNQLEKLLEKSLGSFSHHEITPLVKKGSQYILELFHGPTLSFKDIALQTLGQLFEDWPGESGKRTILGATSGDTGSAAIYGLRGKKGVDAYILFPEGRVSPVQELQMTTVEDDNIHCISIYGSFDDCQDIVKKLFGDLPFKEQMGLSAVNSINWSRITSQIVYYFYGYFRWLEMSGNTYGAELPVSVPTGNFGDILAGFMAKSMGLPLAPLVIASNDNDILTRFHETGSYVMKGVAPTISPAMDIQISSNFERLLFFLYDGDGDKIASLMNELKKNKEFSVSEEVLNRFRESFGAARVGKQECLSTIKSFSDKNSYVLDPHSAVGVKGGEKVLGEGAEFMSLSTAHPGKFQDAVELALGSAYELPPVLKVLEGKKSRKVVLPATAAAVKEYLLNQ